MVNTWGRSFSRIMNEKFFDLRKEKQDRIMGAAMEVFAKSGYAHASTDEMVKLAHISKGLLFHYFTSKLGLYGFLYDYSLRFISLEFQRNVTEKETDFFKLQIRMLAAWTDAMRQYPYIRLFLMRCEEETDPEALSVIAEKRAGFTELTQQIAERYDRAPFKEDAPVELVSNIVWYVLTGFLTEIDKKEENWLARYEEGSLAYLETLKRMSYR